MYPHREMDGIDSRLGSAVLIESNRGVLIRTIIDLTKRVVSHERSVFDSDGRDLLQYLFCVHELAGQLPCLDCSPNRSPEP